MMRRAGDFLMCAWILPLVAAVHVFEFLRQTLNSHDRHTRGDHFRRSG